MPLEVGNKSFAPMSVRIVPPLYVPLTRVRSGRTKTTCQDEEKVRLMVLLPTNSSNELDSIHGRRQH